MLKSHTLLKSSTSAYSKCNQLVPLVSTDKMSRGLEATVPISSLPLRQVSVFSNKRSQVVEAPQLRESSVNRLQTKKWLQPPIGLVRSTCHTPSMNRLRGSCSTCLRHIQICETGVWERHMQWSTVPILRREPGLYVSCSTDRVQPDLQLSRPRSKNSPLLGLSNPRQANGRFPLS